MKIETSFHKMTAALGMLVFVSLVFVSVYSQQSSPRDPRRPLGPDDRQDLSTQKPPYQSPGEPVTCEIAGVYIDDAIRRAKSAEVGSYLIVIARLGDGERAQTLNRNRLGAIRGYLQYHPDVSLVTAEGERVPNYGRVELFVSGKLLYILPIAKNARLDLFRCLSP